MRPPPRSVSDWNRPKSTFSFSYGTKGLAEPTEGAAAAFYYNLFILNKGVRKALSHSFFSNDTFCHLSSDDHFITKARALVPRTLLAPLLEESEFGKNLWYVRNVPLFKRNLKQFSNSKEECSSNSNFFNVRGLFDFLKEFLNGMPMQINLRNDNTHNTVRAKYDPVRN